MSEQDDRTVNLYDEAGRVDSRPDRGPDDTQVIPRLPADRREASTPQAEAGASARQEVDSQRTLAARSGSTRWGAPQSGSGPSMSSRSEPTGGERVGSLTTSGAGPGVTRQSARAASTDPGERPPSRGTAHAREGEGAAGPRTPGGTRRARLALTRMDPLSIFKVTLVFSLCVFLVVLVATALVWQVLSSAGVFTSLEKVTSSFPSVHLEQYVAFSRVMGAAAFFGAVNVLLWTCLTTLSAVVYNLSVRLVGGVTVTLSESDG